MVVLDTSEGSSATVGYGRALARAAGAEHVRLARVDGASIASVVRERITCPRS